VPTRPWRLGVPRGGEKGRLRLHGIISSPPRPRSEARERPRGGHRVSPQSPLDTGFGFDWNPLRVPHPPPRGGALVIGREKGSHKAPPAQGRRKAKGGVERALKGGRPPKQTSSSPQSPLSPSPSSWGKLACLHEASIDRAPPRLHDGRASPAPMRGKGDPTEEMAGCRGSTTSVLTATALVYTFGAGITAATNTKLALQLLLTEGFKFCSFQWKTT